MQGIHRWPVNSPHKGLVTRKKFPYDDIMGYNRTNKFNQYSQRAVMWNSDVLFDVSLNKQLNENALGQRAVDQNLHFDKYVGLMAWYHEDMHCAIRCCWLLTVMSFSWGLWLLVLILTHFMTSWPWPLTLKINRVLYERMMHLCQICWVMSKRAWVMRDLLFGQTHKQTVKWTYFWQVTNTGIAGYLICHDVCLMSL